jgi:hypothetical protein
MSETVQAPETMPVVIVRGRPRKTIEQQIRDINNKTAINETKRKAHNDIMKKYYQDNKEKILENKRLARKEAREAKAKSK